MSRKPQKPTPPKTEYSDKFYKVCPKCGGRGKIASNKSHGWDVCRDCGVVWGVDKLSFISFG